MRILPPFEERIRHSIRDELAKKPTITMTALQEQLEKGYDRDFHFTYLRKLVGTGMSCSRAGTRLLLFAYGSFWTQASEEGLLWAIARLEGPLSLAALVACVCGAARTRRATGQAVGRSSRCAAD